MLAALTAGLQAVNEGIDWSGSIRFLDKDNNAVKNFRVALRGE